MYRVFINYCVFFLKIFEFFWTLPVLLHRWCSTCLVCVHTHWQRGKTEKSRVRNILKSSKKTQYLMNTLYVNSITNIPFCTCEHIHNPSLLSLPSIHTRSHHMYWSHASRITGTSGNYCTFALFPILPCFNIRTFIFWLRTEMYVKYFGMDTNSVVCRFSLLSIFQN